MDIELIDYDVEGAAYKDGVVVDGAYLLATVKRRPTPGVLGEKPGDAVRLRIDLAGLDDKTRGRLLAAFGALEAAVLDVATAEYVAHAASPSVLDAKIDAAVRAQKDLEAAQKSLEAKHQELAEVEAKLAAAKSEPV